MQEKGAEKVLFGYEDIMAADDEDAQHPAKRRTRAVADGTAQPPGDTLDDSELLIITEGEIDKLSCNEVLLPLWEEVP